MELTESAARGLLVRAQRLAGPEREGQLPVADIVRAVVGIQAQDMGAASLGVRARLAGTTSSEVESARLRERSIVRVWCMRGTLHLVAAEDARWLVSLLGPVGLVRGRRRRAEMGVNTPEALAAVRRVLAEHGPLTRHELAAAVRLRGVSLAGDPQAPVHLVACAALEGHVCEAAPRGGEPTYALTDDWLGPGAERVDRDAALAELARRHAVAHPPAAPEDLAAWSGLGIRDARRGFESIAGELDEVRVLARRAWVPRGAAPAAGPPSVRLLPAFDGLLLGHRDRALTVRREHARAVLPGGGVLRPTLLVGGRVEGTWRLERGVPTVDAFEPPSAGVAAAVAAESADVERHRGS
jgi:Winged helix DNA-binding domain